MSGAAVQSETARGLVVDCHLRFSPDAVVRLLPLLALRSSHRIGCRVFQV